MENDKVLQVLSFRFNWNTLTWRWGCGVVRNNRKKSFPRGPWKSWSSTLEMRVGDLHPMPASSSPQVLSQACSGLSGEMGSLEKWPLNWMHWAKRHLRGHLASSSTKTGSMVIPGTQHCGRTMVFPSLASSPHQNHQLYQKLDYFFPFVPCSPTQHYLHGNMLWDICKVECYADSINGWVFHCLITIE